MMHSTRRLASGTSHR